LGNIKDVHTLLGLGSFPPPQSGHANNLGSLGSNPSGFANPPLKGGTAPRPLTSAPNTIPSSPQLSIKQPLSVPSPLHPAAPSLHQSQLFPQQQYSTALPAYNPSFTPDQHNAAQYSINHDCLLIPNHSYFTPSSIPLYIPTKLHISPFIYDAEAQLERVAEEYMMYREERAQLCDNFANQLQSDLQTISDTFSKSALKSPEPRKSSTEETHPKKAKQCKSTKSYKKNKHGQQLRSGISDEVEKPE